MSSVRRFLNALQGDGEVFEIRIRNTAAGTVSGYFNDINAATRSIELAELEFEPAAIYCTLNPAKPDPTTTNRQIIARRWLFVDIDPIREADISSTDRDREPRPTHNAPRSSTVIGKVARAGEDLKEPALMIGIVGGLALGVRYEFATNWF